MIFVCLVLKSISALALQFSFISFFFPTNVDVEIKSLASLFILFFSLSAPSASTIF